MSRWFVPLVIIFAFAAGCSTVGKMSVPALDVPSWADGPQTYISDDGYVYAVGTTNPMVNVALAKRVAEENARSRLLLFFENNPLVNGQRYTKADMSWVEVPKLVYSLETKRAYSLVRCKLPAK